MLNFMRTTIDGDKWIHIVNEPNVKIKGKFPDALQKIYYEQADDVKQQIKQGEILHYYQKTRKMKYGKKEFKLDCLSVNPNLEKYRKRLGTYSYSYDSHKKLKWWECIIVLMILIAIPLFLVGLFIAKWAAVAFIIKWVFGL